MNGAPYTVLVNKEKIIMSFLDSPSEGASCFWHPQQHNQHKQLQNPFFWRCAWNLWLHYKCYNRVHPVVSSENHKISFLHDEIEFKGKETGAKAQYLTNMWKSIWIDRGTSWFIYITFSEHFRRTVWLPPLLS